MSKIQVSQNPDFTKQDYFYIRTAIEIILQKYDTGELGLSEKSIPPLEAILEKVKMKADLIEHKSVD